MSEPTRIRASLLLGVALSVLACSRLPAEVGVILHPNGSVSSMIVHIIVDDPDPITISWTPYHSGSSNFVLLNPAGSVAGDHKPSLLMSLR